MRKGVKQIAWYAKEQNNPIKVIRSSFQIMNYCCLTGGKAHAGWPLGVPGPIYDTTTDMFESSDSLNVFKKPPDTLLSE